jgi:hypothetical protein
VYTHKRGPEKYDRTDGKQADRKKVLRPTPLRVKLNLDPLINEEDFQRAQAILERTNKAWKNSRSTDSRFEAIGLLTCVCGEKMYSVSGKRNGTKRRDYYRCKTSHRGNGCGHKHAERNATHHTINSFVQEYLASPATLTTLLQNASKQQPMQDNSNAVSEINRLQAAQARLLHLAVQGLFPQEQLAKEAKHLESQLAAWQGLLTNAVTTNAQHDPEGIAAIATQIAGVLTEFAYLTSRQRKQLLNQLFATIELDNGNITAVTLRLPAAKTRSRTGTDSWRRSRRRMRETSVSSAPVQW